MGSIVEKPKLADLRMSARHVNSLACAGATGLTAVHTAKHHRSVDVFLGSLVWHWDRLCQSTKVTEPANNAGVGSGNRKCVLLLPKFVYNTPRLIGRFQ